MNLDPKFLCDAGCFARIYRSCVVVAIGQQNQNLALGFRIAKPIHTQGNSIPDRGRKFFLERLFINDSALSIPNSLWNFETLYDVNQRTMIEG